MALPNTAQMPYCALIRNGAHEAGNIYCSPLYTERAMACVARIDPPHLLPQYTVSWQPNCTLYPTSCPLISTYSKHHISCFPQEQGIVSRVWGWLTPSSWWPGATSDPSPPSPPPGPSHDQSHDQPPSLCDHSSSDTAAAEVATTSSAKVTFFTQYIDRLLELDMYM